MNSIDPKLVNYLSNPNELINGCFGIWQRGASFNANGYTADRWRQDTTNTPFTVERTNVLPEHISILSCDYVMRIHNIVSAGALYNDLYQRIEGLSKFSGKTVTLSFQAYNAGSGSTIRAIPKYSPDNTTFTEMEGKDIEIGTDWSKRYSWTFTIPDMSHLSMLDGSNLQITFNVEGLTDVFIANIKLEFGENPTSFIAERFNANLAQCQRYFFSGSPIHVATYGYEWSGMAEKGIYFPEPMRAIPAISLTKTAGMETQIIHSNFNYFALRMTGITTTGGSDKWINIEADAEL